ncbi:MAG: ABC transporter permease, partial [Pseudomonadota bacterium]
MADSQDYETVVKAPAAEEVAHFDDDHKGLLGKVQHALHVNPALVPLIILVFAISLFGILIG